MIQTEKRVPAPLLKTTEGGVPNAVFRRVIILEFRKGVLI